MYPIEPEIKAAIARLGVSAKRISVDEALGLRRLIAKAYGSAWPLWERLAAKASIHAPNGWRQVADLVGDAECVLLMNPEDDPAMFRFDTGRTLSAVLGECFGFEFYVTDSDASYLLCLNHHDRLIGAGRAMKWIVDAAADAERETPTADPDRESP